MGLSSSLTLAPNYYGKLVTIKNTSTFWYHLHYIPVVKESESGLCPKPVSAMTVMSTIDAEGGQTDTRDGEGKVTLVSSLVSLPQEETVVE